VQGAGALFPAQALHAFGDRAAGNQHHFALHAAQGGDLRGPGGDGVLVEAGAAIGDEAAAYLDDEAARVGEQGFHGVYSVGVAAGFWSRRAASRCAMMA
jgi:hypothetical protein